MGSSQLRSKGSVEDGLGMLALAPLPYPVYFVNEDTDKWHDLYNVDKLPSHVDSLYERCASSADTWSAQVYIHLKQRGLNVHFVPRALPGKICVVPYHHLKLKNFPFNSYIVACQYDCARPEICEQRIVLNRRVALSEQDQFVHHWHHPMLKPRDRSRGDQLKNIAFKGRARNLAAPFLDPAFAQELNAYGIEFCLDSEGEQEDSSSSFRAWGDHTNTDSTLSVRNATEKDLLMKPAVKLINAWHAGCPTIVSPEPAYQDLYRSELDYIEVRSPKEVIAALKRLKDNPGLYAAMIEHGFERAQEFTTDRLALQWRDLLASAIAQGYEQWRHQSPVQKLVGRPLQFAQRTVRHKQEFKRYLDNIHNGARLFQES